MSEVAPPIAMIFCTIMGNMLNFEDPKIKGLILIGFFKCCLSLCLSERQILLTSYSNAVGVSHGCCLSLSVVLCNGCIVATQ